jgi:peptidoglycan/xylan/chitin deacetylase (PgdA/CDA1 family)
MKEIQVPVYMYHSIGIPDREWKWSYLTTPYRQFEEQMKWLKRCGFTAIHFDQYYDYIFNGKRLPKNPVILTFDDGYVDNYIFAYPIMKKYGMVGTVYINSDFIDPRDIKRPIYSGGEEPRSQECRGFLSLPEMQELEASNVLRMESHAQTHTWYPVSGRIIDFRHPDDRHDWMTWNEHVDKKPFLQVDDEQLVRYGAPVFENEKSLMATRFYPDVDLTSQLEAHVEENGGKAFFLNPDWKARLEEYTIALNGSLEVSGRSENESENYARIKAELEHSKTTLEKAIGRQVIMLCWPGGSGSKQGEKALKELGYKLSTAARDLSYSERKALTNNPSQKSTRVARISPMTYHDNIADHGSVIIYSSGPIMVLKALIFKNWLGARYWGNGILFLLQTFYKLVNR